MISINRHNNLATGIMDMGAHLGKGHFDLTLGQGGRPEPLHKEMVHVVIAQSGGSSHSMRVVRHFTDVAHIQKPM